MPPVLIETGFASGLSRADILRFIVLPQALKTMIPAIISTIVMMFKITSLIYIVGITYFVTRPALAEGSGRKALVAGALLGFVAYATWDLTNLAVIEGFPASIVAVDLAWGTFATAVASVVTYAVCRRVPALG